MVDPLLLMFLKKLLGEAIPSLGVGLACTRHSSIDHIGTHQSVVSQHG